MVMRSNKPRINKEIRFKADVRVVDESGVLIGMMPAREALAIAEERSLDLVEIAPDSRPPVCKIMDYGKFLYSTKKSMKKNKTPPMKEMKFTPNTDVNDVITKVKKIKGFLSKGSRVQAIVRFRGRQNAHPEIGVNLLNQVREMIEQEIDHVRFSIKKAERSVIMMIERVVA